MVDFGMAGAARPDRDGGHGSARCRHDQGRGYFKIEDIEACEKAGIFAYVPKPIRGPAAREGFFTKEEFRYVAERDVFICLGRAELSPRHSGRSHDIVEHPFGPSSGGWARARS